MSEETLEQILQRHRARLLDGEPSRYVIADLLDLGAATLPAMEEWLREPPSPVSRSAIFVLGKSGERTAAAALARRLVADDGKLTWPVLSALYSLGEAARPELAALLKHQHAHIRQAAARALIDHPHPSMVPALLRLLQEEADEVVWAATQALASFPDPEVIQTLLDTLAKYRSTASFHVRFALQRSPCATWRELVLLAVQRPLPSALRVELLAAFRHPLPAHLPPLVRPLLTDDEPRVRKVAISLLASAGNAEDLPRVTACLGDSAPEVRMAAVAAWNLLPKEISRELLIPCLEDEDLKVRTAALDALARAGEPSAVDMLLESLEILEDENRISSLALLLAGVTGRQWSRVLSALLPVVSDAPQRWGVRMALQRMAATNGAEVARALHKTLQSGGPEQRLGAAQVLSELPWLKALPDFQRLSTDPNGSFRAAAVAALGHLAASFGSERVGDLRKFVQDPMAAVRAKAALALRQSQPNGWEETVCGLLEDPEAEVRRAATAVLAHGRAEVVGPWLLAALDSALPNGTRRPVDERCRLVETLGKVRYAPAADRLHTLLRSTAEPTLRPSFIFALGEMRDPRSLPVLLEEARVAAANEEHSLWCWLAEAFAKLPDGRAVPFLVAGLSSSFALAQEQCAVALGTVASRLPSIWEGTAVRKEAVTRLHALLRHPEESVRTAALRALGRVGGSDAAQVLLEYRETDDGGLEWPLFQALCRVGSPEVVPCLTSYLDHPERRCRQAAAQGLGRVGTGALPALAEALLSPSARVRGLAAITLRKLGLPGAVPHLLGALPEPLPLLRARLIGALAQCALPEDTAALTALLDAAEDPAAGVRQAALNGLAAQGRTSRPPGRVSGGR